MYIESKGKRLATGAHRRPYKKKLSEKHQRGDWSTQEQIQAHLEIERLTGLDLNK